MSGTRMVRATVPDGVYARLKRMAIEYDGTMTTTAREAIEIGLRVMEEEASKYEKLEESDYSNIRELVMRTRIS